MERGRRRVAEVGRAVLGRVGLSTCIEMVVGWCNVCGDGAAVTADTETTAAVCGKCWLLVCMVMGGGRVG